MDYCTWLLWTWDVPHGNTLQSTCVDGTSLEWTGLDCREGHKTGLDYTALHFTALDCYRLCLASPDCIKLHFLGLNWKSPYRIVCIARDLT